MNTCDRINKSQSWTAFNLQLGHKFGINTLRAHFCTPPHHPHTPPPIPPPLDTPLPYTHLPHPPIPPNEVYIHICLWIDYYKWAKRMKFLFAVKYGSPPRRHSNSSKAFLRNRKKLKQIFITILGLTQLFKTINRPGPSQHDPFNLPSCGCWHNFKCFRFYGPWVLAEVG